MTLEEYIDFIKLELTGGVLELEISDDAIANQVMRALKEVQRYIDTPKFVTVPYAECIDLKGFKCSAITHIYRTRGYADGTLSTTGSLVDPLYAQQWMMFSSGGNMYNLNNYLMNYASYNTLLQIRNNTSTDLFFKQDKMAEKLYINCPYDKPANITIEYIPVFENVEEVTSDYWIDILQRLALAHVKIALGRIRTRYTLSNALWQQDGESLLNEGTEELNELRETLRINKSLFIPID